VTGVQTCALPIFSNQLQSVLKREGSIASGLRFLTLSHTKE